MKTTDCSASIVTVAYPCGSALLSDQKHSRKFITLPPGVFPLSLIRRWRQSYRINLWPGFVAKALTLAACFLLCAVDLALGVRESPHFEEDSEVELSNQGMSMANAFVLDVDVPRHGAIYRVAVAAGRGALVAFDRGNGLPFAYMRDGLMVTLDPDRPGSLAVRQGGNPEFQFGTDDNGNLRLDIEFTERADPLIRLNWSGLIEGLSRGVIERREVIGEIAGIVTVTTSKSTTTVVWGDDDFPFRAWLMETTKGEAIGINSIHFQRETAEHWLGLSYDDFAALGSAAPRKIELNDAHNYWRAPSESFGHADFVASAKAMARLLDTGNGPFIKAMIDRNLRILGDRPKVENAHDLLLRQSLVRELEQGVVLRFVNRPQAGLRGREAWGGNSVDARSYLLAELGTSETLNRIQAIWEVSLFSDELAPQFRARLFALLGKLGVPPDDDTLEEMKKLIAEDGNPTLALAMRSCLAYLGLAERDHLTGLSRVLQNMESDSETRLVALTGLLRAQAMDGEDADAALSLFEELAVLEAVHETGAREAVALFARDPEGLRRLMEAIQTDHDPNLLERYIHGLRDAMRQLDERNRGLLVRSLTQFAARSDVPERAFLNAIQALQAHAQESVFLEVIESALASPVKFKPKWSLSVLAAGRRGGDFIASIARNFNGYDAATRCNAISVLITEERASVLDHPHTQQILLAGLRDPDATVRISAITAVSVMSHGERLPDSQSYIGTLGGLLAEPKSDRETQALVKAFHHLSKGEVTLDGVPRNERGYFRVDEDARTWWKKHLKPSRQRALEWVKKQTSTQDDSER